MIVNTLKMCTGNAGPEQSLVLFSLRLGRSKTCPNEEIMSSLHVVIIERPLKLKGVAALSRFCLFDSILYSPSTIFQLCRDGSS